MITGICNEIAKNFRKVGGQVFSLCRRLIALLRYPKYFTCTISVCAYWPTLAYYASLKFKRLFESMLDVYVLHILH